MPTGSIWIKNSAGNWVQGPLYVKTPTTGWARGYEVYQKTGASTWTMIYDGDITPPAAPTSNNSYDASKKYYNAQVVLPTTSDTVRGCIKVSTTAYPVNPGVVTSGDTFTYANSVDGTPIWLWDAIPGGAYTRRFTGMVSGKKYYVSAWAQDDSGNWSSPYHYTFTFPYPPAPTKTLVTKSAYVSVTDSASWRSAYGWQNDNTYVYQGGDYDWRGYWFYGSGIANLLKNAESLTKVEMYIQRVNSSHGIAGDGNIMLGYHGYSAQPGGTPAVVSGKYNVVDLARGEGKWVTLNNAWRASILSGSIKGFGLDYGSTSVSSSYYNYCYGRGTSSGRLKLTWTEYQ